MLFRVCKYFTQNLFKSKLSKYYLIPCKTLFAAAIVKTNEETTFKLKDVDPVTLKPSFLIKNASLASVDASLSLLSQTVEAIIDTNNKYVMCLKKLVGLMERNMEVMGTNETLEDEIWQFIIAVRSDMARCKQALQELNELFSVVERLVYAGAEAAFLSGADHSSSIANGQLSQAQTKLNILRQTTDDWEIRVAQVEVKMIEVADENTILSDDSGETDEAKSDQPTDTS